MMVMRVGIIKTAVLLFTCLVFESYARAGVVEYELTLAQQEIDFTGRKVEAMTINGGIPGPILRFKEGDTARIKVHNKMRVDTSIHWHGILVPPDMDGVPNISFPPIEAGTTFVYEFPIRQSGTYWYHSHTRLQEQRGVYGGIVISPPHGHHPTDRDYTVVLSDWTDEDPHEVLRTLKRGSEWYAVQKGSGQSILGAARLGMLGDYLKRELQRMPAMDIADVAYDRFLANGMPQTMLDADPGETVRLRIIDGSATTYFHLEFAGGPMKIISADGIDVQPVEESRFLIAVAETYDVIIKIPAQGAYELRATAHDGSGDASVWIGSGKRHPAPDVPKPNLYQTMGGLDVNRIFALTPAGSMGMPDRDVNAGKFDQPGMDHGHGMPDMEHHSGHSDMKKGDGGMDQQSHAAQASHDVGMQEKHQSHTMENRAHSGHQMERHQEAVRNGKRNGRNFRPLAGDVSASKSLANDGVEPVRPWSPYAKLRAGHPTAFDKNKPVREIRLTLDGDMARYVWFLNNKPLSESDDILIRKGEIARFIMINRTMMHHPMHLHGHFFRVLNGQKDYAPLKHTVNVAPMSTTVIEFDANEFGDWFFHCHLLYHMKSGMARVVHYENYTPGPAVAAIRSNLYKESGYAWGQADILSHMTEGFLTLSDSRNIFTAEWEVGWQEVEDTEWEAILTYDRYINRFFSLFAGIDVLGEDDEEEETRGVFGLRYLLPFNLESRSWVDTDGGARITLEKEFHLTPRLSLVGEAEYDTHTQWEGKAGLNYAINKHMSLVAQWHSDFGWGGGIQVRF
ncbi:MAG: multicopper oxidase domain-containing protein [Deltaproteobacteria bacterium]|nr:multicopper oxidase domain-containing protein [Deltaproteobacteria bacterium]